MDQKTLDTCFKTDVLLNIIADLMLGVNLLEHLNTLQKNIDAVDFIIEQEGFLIPEIGDLLSVKEQLSSLISYVEKMLTDPDFTIDIPELKIPLQ